MPEGNGNFRDRIKELRRVKASELLDNPKNWRMHPQTQSRALKSILTEIGYAQALVARELDDGQLVLIDGHLRKDMNPNQDIPVLIVDLDENEADIMLATLDPIGEMAGRNDKQLITLLEQVRTKINDDVQDVLNEIHEFTLPVLGNDLEKSIGDNIELCNCPICGHEHSRPKK